ncbi:MAG: DUF4867 family protein [Treponemataceae bacterium]|nr:DUF4867 family protein [Treponemataceae bacterium]
MEILDRLNSVNDVPVTSVFSEEFASYGRVLKGYDFSALCDYMEKHTDIPENGNVYVASVPEMEKIDIYKKLSHTVYGGMDIQIGYCNGRNSTYNGFEYHKGSEINVAVTDFVLCLGHVWEIKDNHYDNKDARLFFVPKGTAIEMFQTTLHLSPLKVCDQGFKGIVVLPRGTNTPLSDDAKKERDLIVEKMGETKCENRLLLQKNKWVISHPEREPLIKQGAFPGIIGENKEMKY